MAFETPEFPEIQPSISESSSGNAVRQLTVFLQNKVGELANLVNLLADKDVVVLGLSVWDSSDHAIIRLVVSDPDEVEHIFHEHGVAYGLADMVVVELREGAPMLNKMLSAILMAEVNIHFSYPLLVRPNGHATLALHVEDYDCASYALRTEGFTLFNQADLSR
jgi:hypothetical protein